MEQNLQIVFILAIGFGVASILGYLAQRLKLPSILGYLLAGYVIGPYSPGFVADKMVSEQLAEIGVILMLFSVGLHFKLEDLSRVKHIAIPGAIVQTLVSASAGTLLVYSMGWPLYTGIIIGLAIGVASTVVLIRVLTEFRLLATIQGHIAVGWLIVEDILTVAVLILLPMLATLFHGEMLSGREVAFDILFAFAKFFALVVIMFTLGIKLVASILTSIARLHSHELFTLTVLALVFVIATGSSFIFGTSIALGSFIAGMVIGKTNVRHQAAANALPLKDVFAIFFFLSVGMLFNPETIIDHFPFFVGVIAIILLIKPLAAYLLVISFGLSIKIALTVAVALAQIGEFSFILGEQAKFLKLLPPEGFDILVACAIISIPINPMLFQLIDYIERRKQNVRPLKYIRAKLLKESPHPIPGLFDFPKTDVKKVIIVGFGPIGRGLTFDLKKMGYHPTVIEQNIDIVSQEENQSIDIIFGDATMPNILEAAKISSARLLVITPPKIATTVDIIHSARHLNPQIRIVARIRYLADLALMEELGVSYVCGEKEMSTLLLSKARSLIQYAKPIIKQPPA